MKVLNKFLTVLVVLSIALTMFLVPEIAFAENFMDAGWSADFDTEFGGFPQSWSNLTVNIDEKHGQSLDISTQWWFTDPSPFKDKVIDTKDGIYVFSAEIYIGGTSRIGFKNSKSQAGDADSVLLNYEYDTAGKKFRFFNEQGNFAQTEIEYDLELGKWHKLDVVIDLAKGTQKYNIDGENLGTIKILSSVLEAIESEGGYSLNNLYFTTNSNVAIDTEKRYAMDNISFTKYEANDFYATSGSLTDIASSSDEVALEFKNSVDPITLTNANIIVKKHLTDDILMENGTNVDITVSDTWYNGCTVLFDNGIEENCFYSIDMSSIKDITGGAFCRPVKVMMKQIAAASSVTTPVATHNFDDLLDSYVSSTTPPLGFESRVTSDYGTSTAIQYSKYAYTDSESVSQTGLKLSNTSAPRGMWKKIKLDKNAGVVDISFDYIRLDADSNNKFVIFNIADSTKQVTDRLLAMRYSGQWPTYYDEALTTPTQINNAAVVGEVTPITFSIDIANQEVTLKYKTNNPVTYNIYKNLDWTSDTLYFCIDLDTVGSQVAIDNLTITHTYQDESSVKFAGGVTFFDYNDNAVIISENTVKSSVSKIKFPVSSNINASDINVSLLENGLAYTVKSSSYDIDNNEYVIEIDGVLKANTDYTLVVGDFADNAGSYTFKTGDGVFEVSDLKILGTTGNEVENVAGCAAIKLSADVLNNNDDMDIHFIVAVYKDNMLKKAYGQQYTVNSGMYGSAITDELIIDVSDADTVSAFVWKSFKTVEPLCDKKEINN